MTAPVFGYTPQKRDLALTTGADFFLTMSLQGSAKWPDDTQLRIEIDGQVWHAFVDDTTARWRVESALCDIIEDKTPYTMSVSYPGTADDPTVRDDLVWFYGRVKRTKIR